MSAEKKTFEEKIACIVRMLGSDRDHEVLASVRALKRTLTSAGADLNDLPNGIEKLGKTNGGGPSREEIKAEIQRVFNALLSDGRKKSDDDPTTH